MGDVEHVALHVLADDEPAAALLPLFPAELQPAALPEGVVHQPDMLPDFLPVRGEDAPRSGGKVLLQKFAEVALADETDARAVLLARGGEPLARGDRAHFGFLHAAERKEHVCKLRLRHLVEEVRLVLARVRGFQKKVPLLRMRDAAVMPRRNAVRTQLFRIRAEGAELDLAVAQHVGVGRPARLVLGEEVREHALAVLLREIDGVIRHAELVAHPLYVLEVLLGGAGAALLLPVDHEQAHDVIALFFEQESGDGAVHPAAHADDGCLLCAALSFHFA